jgi:hypothetical protein
MKSNVKKPSMYLVFSWLLVLNPYMELKGADVEPFLGRWALTLPNGPGWLEIRQENGYLDADILWLWGSVVPVDHLYMDGETLYITRNRTVERENADDDNTRRSQVITTTLELQVNKDRLNGVVHIPSITGLQVRREEFEGVRIPPLPDPPDLDKLRFDEPIELLNGKDLTGWELVNPNSKNGWRVENGVLINDPQQEEGGHANYGNLQTVEEFNDFNLKLEVNVPAGSNSGIYLRGIYEVQVADSYGKPLDSHHMGAIYSRITPAVNAEKPAGDWQTMDITLYDRYVTVILNGRKIINNQPLKGITGGALTSDQFSPGPLYLQGDHGKVMYRNIILTPIKN